MDKLKKTEKNTKKSLKNTKKSDFFEQIDSKQDIIKALTKKAVGYDSKEIIEEFSLDENQNEHLVKKKITTKNVPPDVTAVKVLLELEKIDSKEDLSSLTDEQLDAKIDEILKHIKENEGNDNND